MARRRLAIVGGDAAGMSAASAARRRDRDLEIVTFERGPYTSYSACGIPYYVGGLFDDSDRLISRSPDEHRARGIDVHARTEVLGVDLDARTLAVRDHQAGTERTEGFDQLVIATGAEAGPPPVPRADATEPVRTADAAQRFRAELSPDGEHQRVSSSAAATSASRWPRRSCSAGSRRRWSRASRRSWGRSTPTWPRTCRTAPRAW